MNHIYEQKAKKYKYKYLKLKKLKNELEYIGEGGYFGYHTNDQLNERINNEINKLSKEQIQNLLNDRNDKKKGYFFNLSNLSLDKYNIHTSDGLEQKINEEIKIRLRNLEKERLERLEKERLQKRKILKNQLILLKGKIEQKIVPLYQQYFVGNITNKIINGLNISIDDSNKTNINDNNPLGLSQTDNVKNAVEKIAKNDEISIYLPPIIKCYFKIDTDRGLTLSKDDLSNLLIKCLQMNKLDKLTFDENQILQLLNNLNNLSKNGNIYLHHMYNIYLNYIRQFEINIDYYALTKVICDLYYDFYYNYIIENNLFSENENNLEKLFINLENDFINNIIEKDNFLKQLNNIINAF